LQIETRNTKKNKRKIHIRGVDQFDSQVDYDDFLLKVDQEVQNNTISKNVSELNIAETNIKKKQKK
jgi:hypothetical protein